MDRLFEQLYARSPGGNPPAWLLAELLSQYRNAAGQLTGGERVRIKEALDRWQNRFDQALPLPAPVVAPPPPPIVIEKVAPVLPAPSHAPAPRRSIIIEKVAPPATAKALEPRRGTLSEQKLAERLDKLIAEFKRSTGNPELSTGLGLELHGFYVRAAQELTADQRQSLRIEMDKWEEKRKALPRQ